ncbi:type 2 isopentenyl-diphosphate Delta-isomerase [Enterococcus sp. CSURQ0835]|uniref:type 2 isopentenyl-diphosphate Delta-isomerase n=1 Tax=Enterococcus sp. CSURQ0835 TaxID=2681394 RepID=UPI0013575C7F|nr:type 2 isopentenyl-diphosphate Delta-isomerase [Enterococcus sp. CSURQ0835]
MNRKDEHLLLAKALYKKQANDFDDLTFVHQSLVDLTPAEVDLSTEVLGLQLTAPFYINAMTGGSEKTKIYNQQLAIVARETGLMMASGSASAALQDSNVAESFTVIRKENPTGLVLANMGAGKDAQAAEKIIDLLQADGLQIHLNVPQELVMPEGEADFKNWRHNIQQITATISKPVIVKEVGFGMSRETLQQLKQLGVQAADVSGKGGTSFTQIENARRSKHELSYLNDWGQSTVTSLLEAQEAELTILASGGVRDAYDIFKALCLGAKAVGISGAILHSLMTVGVEATIDLIESWKNQLRMLYTLTNKKTTAQLTSVPLLVTGNAKAWADARSIDLKKIAQRI